jgi:16S rRNA (adenine1518-N6/adenine1519-N6)-dimethyltransferase
MGVRRMLAQWDLRPAKGLGQNFLVDGAVLGRIVAAADLKPDDVVLEVGAGLGSLTQLLSERAGHVVAVELDDRLIPPLRSVLEGIPSVTLVHGDILALDPTELIDVPGNRYKVVANLPYYITAAVLRHLLEAPLRPQRMIVTVQREVAERIVAQPGGMSLLAVSVQFYGRPRLLFRIKPGSFYPSPNVESAVLCIDRHPAPPVALQDTEAFFRVVRAGFGQRRKQLRNALAAGLAMPAAEVAARLRESGVDSRLRAEALSLEQWAGVARVIGGAEP